MQVTHSAFTDAQQTNESTRSAKVYSDLDLFFTKKDTKDVNILKDIQSNLIQQIRFLQLQQLFFS